MENEKNYTTGQFAKLSKVTERTIRYYDKIGLLKPSFIMENGYRKYCQSDFLKLQKIVSLKHLGFSLDEINSMLINDQSLKESLSLQVELINKKIKHFQLLRDSLSSTIKMADENKIDWDKIIKLVQLSGREEKIVDHYRNESHLSVRIKLHQQFSMNKKGWFSWLFEQIDFNKINRLLEVGSGNGELWKNKNLDLRNKEIFLSDASEGMVDALKKDLHEEFNYMMIDCQKIPFKKEYFDAVIANHVLFYLNDLSSGIHEITRVLKQDGILYCSTYGKDHMREITEIAKEFDERITLADNHLYDIFGLENGKDILKKYFNHIDCIYYPDELIIDEATPIFEYILSCHGNQKDILTGKTNEFMMFLENKIAKQGPIHVKKDAGLFICKK